MTETTDNLTGDDLAEAEEIAEPTKLEKRAMKLERDRCARINEIGGRFNIDAETTADYIQSGASVAEFQAHVRGVQAANLRPVPSAPRVETIEEFGGYGRENVRNAMVDGLLLRNHIEIKKPHPAAKDFSNSSIHDVARILLRQRGDRVQYASPATLMQRALATTDLTELLADVGGKALIVGFEEMEQTHDKWCRFKAVKDFKTQRRIALEAIETLAAVAELDPVTYSAMTDAQETYTIASYQKAISYSRQALVNDDLGGLTELPYMLGKAARRTECNLVYSVLSTNANMADSVKLFAAGRGNYLTGANSPLAEGSLATAVAAIRKAKDIGANGFLGLRPKWLVVPPELELTALKLLATMINAQSSSTAIPNSDFARIEVIVEPRITTATHWYLIADNIDTVEVGRLEWLGGAEWSGTAAGVSFETDKDFSTDSYALKVRLDAGAKAISPLGMVFSDGVTGG